jgi:hypothetical protein
MTPSSAAAGAAPHIMIKNLLLPNRHPKAMSVAALITLLTVLVASGFSIASLVRPELIVPTGTAPSGASAIFAMYAAARTLPLAVAVILAIAMRADPALQVVGSQAGVLQCLDALVGILRGDFGKTIAGSRLSAGIRDASPPQGDQYQPTLGLIRLA